MIMTSQKRLFHIRIPYSASDQTVIGASYYASEMPDPASLRYVGGSELRLLHLRHIAKRATDLEGRPVLGIYPADMTTNAPEAVIKARIKAAQDVIQSWVRFTELEKLAKLTNRLVAKGEEVTFLHRTSITGNSERHNFLFTEYENAVISYLKQSLPHKQLTFSKLTIPVATVPKRTESNPLERLVRQPYVDENTQLSMRGKKIILLDDHVQAGGTFATFYALIKQLGDNTSLIGMNALTIHPTATDLRVSGRILKALHSACASDKDQEGKRILGLDMILSKVGLSIETLTNREALYLIGMLLDGGNQKSKKAYFELISEFDQGVSVPENNNDDFEQLAKSPAMSLDELTHSMGTLIQERNQEIKSRLDVISK